ncbi:type 1 glutamine amidotransferase [Roseisalinus antarcticus]|uniref:GMP synthase [glutamine-hydrolyzing] n=1 Tax=Roseisalinus antarcticus TaxID=254357 RepID=A0A1Y5SY04_9RHOB|nr:type 1 glutamine amidotransferase [Roseisalinus antarcticus]SLN47714.1 GMP synthase [glutamine-hydrolyzing] [Roseisalinus antarcticus]
MHIGILQTGHAPDALRRDFGTISDCFQAMLAGRGFTFSTWNVVDMEFPDGPREADGWLITGSRHGAYEDLPFIAPLEALIRDIHAADVPLVGVCFGHQIIAQALGGKVEKFEGGWQVGRKTYAFGEAQLALNAWHQDQVVALPEGAEVIGTHPMCENAALLYGDRILTVQPHPEYGPELIAGLIEHRGGPIPKDLLAGAAASLAAPVDNADMAGRIARFLTERRVA